MEPTNLGSQWINVPSGDDQDAPAVYRPTPASNSQQGQDGQRNSSQGPPPPSSISLHQTPQQHGVGAPTRERQNEGVDSSGREGEASSSDEGSTESSTATAPSAGAVSSTFHSSSTLDPAPVPEASGLQLPSPTISSFVMSAKSPTFMPASIVASSSCTGSSDPSYSSNPSSSASPISSRPSSSLMLGVGRVGSGSSCATSSTSYVGSGDDGVGAKIGLGAVSAVHGSKPPEPADAWNSPLPVTSSHLDTQELESMESLDNFMEPIARHHDSQQQGARVFSPFRPSSATAPASFTTVVGGPAANTTSLHIGMKSETKTGQPTPSTLSNEAIEAAIQAAIAGSNNPANSAMRSRSGGSSASGSGSGYNSERSDRGEREAGRGGKNSGSDSSRSHGLGGGGGDARSVPPRDTRTLLFVGNLPYRVRWQDLKDLFRRAGTVLRADVSLGPDNRSRGYGTVLLATAEDAGRAIDMLNGYEWQTRILEVRVDRVGGVGNVMPGGPAPGIAGLGAHLGMDQFDTMGAGSLGAVNTGNMSQSNVGYPSTGAYQGSGAMSGMGGGLAHPQHRSQHSIDLASQHQRGLQGQPYPTHQGLSIPNQNQNLQGAFHNQGLGSSAASGMPGGPPGRTLFIGNLPYHVQWQDLKDLFRRIPSNHPIMQHHLQGGMGPPPIDPQGYPYPIIPPSLMTFNVLRADVALGTDGRSKGFGTVVFSNVDEAERARRVFTGYDFNGRQLKVHYDRIITPGSTGSPAPPISSVALGLGNDPVTGGGGGIPLSTASPRLQEPQSHLAAWSSIPQASVQASQFSIRSLALRSSAAPEHEKLNSGRLHDPAHIPPQGRRGWESGDEGEVVGKGFGYDYRSGDERKESRDLQEEQQIRSWEMERQKDREKEQQLYQLLHGSRNQQHRQKQNLFSTSLGSLIGDESGAAAPTTSSAPVSYPHSPSSTFERTSSTSSIASSTSSSSSSVGRQNRHPYRQGDLLPAISTRTSSAASIYDPLDSLAGENDFGMGMVETMLARRMQLGVDAGFRSEVEGSIGGTLGSRSSSAAASTRSLPLGLSAPTFAQGSRLAVRNWINEQDEGGLSSDNDSSQPKSARSSSRTGSTTSPSESGSGSALSRGNSLSSGSGPDLHPPPPSQRRNRTSVVLEAAGSDADISEADGEDGGDEDDETRVRVVPLSALQPGNDIPAADSPAPSQLPRPARPVRLGNRRGVKPGQSKTGDKFSSDRQHPGPIELPPPQPVVPISITPQVARGPSSTAQAFTDQLAQGLFTVHHPFATKEGHDYAQYDYSGLPTVQARSTGPAENAESARKGADEESRQEAAPHQQYQLEQHRYLTMQHQQTQMFATHPTPVTPHGHGLPPLTPSMPPFTLVPTGSAIGQFQARQRSHQQQQAASSRRFASNAPGTLSLPPPQFQMYYQQGQQLPQQQGPLTPPAFLHPLGSPGSPYLLGPHHPLNAYGTQHQQTYHPQAYGQHPLAQSFVQGMSPGHLSAPMISPGHHIMPAMYAMTSPLGPPTGYGPAAMTPGAPLTATGEMPGMHQPYHGAVGAPVQSGSSALQEPKGYFDQVYTTPHQYSFSHAAGGSGRGESGKIEKEILKDSSQFGKNEGVKQGNLEGGDKEPEDEGIAGFRPLVKHTQSDASAADTGASATAHPGFRHTKTDPVPPVGR